MTNLRVLAVLAAGLCFVSCGSREDSSDFRDRDHRRPDRHEEHGSRDEGSISDSRFPTHPHTDITPGSLCSRANELRYPERIKYCNRDVESDLKAQLFVMYDQKFGYHTTQMQRSSFKIDHLIPLCMGGSNNPDNLWPQHESVYQHTDPIEPYLCDTMASGKLKQAEAVNIILTIKQDPFHAEDELRKLEARF